MRKFWLLALVFCLPHTTMAQKPGAVIDVQHYSFDVTLSDNSNIIKSKTAINVSYLKTASQIAFDFISGKGMKVLQVTENSKPLSYSHANNLITINAPHNTGDSTTIIISYEGIPADGLIIDNNKFGKRGFFSDNWPNRARHWLPCVDHPADKASVEFIVTAPSHYQVVSNGLKIEELDMGTVRRTHYKETVPLSTKIMALGVTGFAVQLSGMVDCIPVYSYVYPEEMDKGFYDYALAKDILPFFIHGVGPFAYKKLANVQSKTIFGGMENAGAIFYSEETSITGTRKSESLLVHEIAHQWFGNMATEADFSHLWLSEGFATYMTDLFFEYKYGVDTARIMRQQQRDQVIAFARKKMRPVVDSTITDYMQLLNANSYQKGGWILHMLRRQLGDTLFWKGVRNYYGKFAGKNAVTSDLQKAFEEVSGANLKQFFHQWLYTAGHPLLNVQSKYNAAKKDVTITILQQQPTIYTFPLEIQVGDEIKIISIKDKKTVVTFASPQSPQLVIDPEINLLFEKR